MKILCNGAQRLSLLILLPPKPPEKVESMKINIENSLGWVSNAIYTLQPATSLVVSVFTFEPFPLYSCGAASKIPFSCKVVCFIDALSKQSISNSITEFGQKTNQL